MKTGFYVIWFAGTAFCQTADQQRLTVCMQPYGSTVQAREVTSRIYAEIGIEIRWQMDLRRCPEGALRIKFDTRTPDTRKPGALGYSMPYADSTIVIFYDRVAGPGPHEPRMFGRLLGHVLAHEIGHVLERMDRHSKTGIMKAHWKGGDFMDIAASGLKFEKMDVILIHEGMETRRQAELAATRNRAESPGDK